MMVCRGFLNMSYLEFKDVCFNYFTLKDEFGYDCAVGDIIQVGIRIWTIDNTGKKIYDATSIKTSNAICLLNNPLQVYLNIK